MNSFSGDQSNAAICFFSLRNIDTVILRDSLTKAHFSTWWSCQDEASGPQQTNCEQSRIHAFFLCKSHCHSGYFSIPHHISSQTKISTAEVFRRKECRVLARLHCYYSQLVAHVKSVTCVRCQTLAVSDKLNFNWLTEKNDTRVVEFRTQVLTNKHVMFYSSQCPFSCPIGGFSSQRVAP